MRGVITLLTLAGLGLGCGDNRIGVTARVHPDAEVRVLDAADGMWRPVEVSGSMVELTPDGPYGIAMLHDDVATVVLAGLDDARDWVLWSGLPPDTTMHPVTLRLVDTAGPADVSIGTIATVLSPGQSATVMVAEGFTDLIAFRGDRVIVRHELAIDGEVSVDVDFARDGQAMVPRGVSPDSPFVAVPTWNLRTRRGVTLAASYQGAAPAAALAEGDRQWLRFDGEEVAIEVDLAHAGDAPLWLPEPTPLVADAAWEDGTLALRWPGDHVWTSREVYAAARLDDARTVAWFVRAHPGWDAEPGRYALPLGAGAGAGGWDVAYAIPPGTELWWWTAAMARPLDDVLTEHARDSYLQPPATALAPGAP